MRTACRRMNSHSVDYIVGVNLMAKRVKVNIGDVFLIKLENGLFGAGVSVK